LERRGGGGVGIDVMIGKKKGEVEKEGKLTLKVMVSVGATFWKANDSFHAHCVYIYRGGVKLS